MNYYRKYGIKGEEGYNIIAYDTYIYIKKENLESECSFYGMVCSLVVVGVVV